MRVFFHSSNPKKDPLHISSTIPARLSKYLFDKAEKHYCHASYYGYLEQRYGSNESALCYLDFNFKQAGVIHPISDEPLLVLVYIFKGRIVCRLEGYGEFTAEQGNGYLLYVPKEILHTAAFQKGYARIAYCCFAKSFLEDMAKENAEIASMLRLFDNRSSIGSIINPAPIGKYTIRQMWKIRDCNVSPAYCESFLKTRIWNLVLDYVKQGKEGALSPGMLTRKALIKREKIFMSQKMIDENKTGKLTIRKIAKKVGLTEYELKKEFKDEFGVPIGEYERQSRFEKSCELLTGTDFPISKIAERMGYPDSPSFTRFFKKRQKMSPMEFRQNHNRLSE